MFFIQNESWKYTFEGFLRKATPTKNRFFCKSPLTTFLWGGMLGIFGDWFMVKVSLNMKENLPAGFGCQCLLLQKPLPPSLDSLFLFFFKSSHLSGWKSSNPFSLNLSLTFGHFLNVPFFVWPAVMSSNAFKSETRIIVAKCRIESFGWKDLDFKSVKIFTFSTGNEEMNSMLLPNWL